MKDSITVKTPAKLNLFLEVLGIDDADTKKRHVINTVFQAINIFDTLTIKKSDKTAIHFVENKYTKGVSDKLPELEDNICYKAILLFRKVTKDNTNFDITIDKNIHLSAGMAGGSSDCAATLFGINALTGNKLSHDELLSLSSELGSDIAFLLEVINSNYKTTACLAENFGDIISPITLKKESNICLITFNFGLSTKDIYKKFDTNKSGCKQANNTANKTFADTYQLHNDLQQPALEESKVLKNIIDWFNKNKIPAQVTGSGPTIFAFLESEGQLEAVKSEFQDIEEIDSISLVEFL